MGTKLILDVSRTELLEGSFTYQKHAEEMTGTANKNLINQWLHTKTFTLMPLQYTPAFSQSSDWEAVKFRLSDVNYLKDWWTEVPEQQVNGTPCDYFFHGKVIDTNVPSPYKGHFPLLELMTDISEKGIISRIKFEDEHSVQAFTSRDTFPANQGYHLRWYQGGRGSYTRSNILGFYFGDFAVALSTNGQAYVFQTPDFTTYSFVYSFPWALESEVHNRWHKLTIFPHCRNKIEFRTSTIATSLNVFGFGKLYENGTHGGGCYTIPGELVFDGSGTSVITQPGPWRLAVSREFRPQIQVSRLAFANGSSTPDGAAVAGLWDDSVHVGYAPTMPIMVTPDADLNGGQILAAVYDGVTKTPFVSDGSQEAPQAGFGFYGIGDIAGPGGGGSSTTPELYGYTVYKPARTQFVARSPQAFSVQAVTCDLGDKPESEHLTVTIDNSQRRLAGDADRFTRRAHIPLILIDTETGIVLYEGTAFKVNAGEAPAQRPRRLRIDARGMISSLVGQYWGPECQDFSADPFDTAGRAYFWTDAVKACFEAGGFDKDTQVVIEEESKYKFRLWLDGDSGGPSGGAPVGDGHHDSATAVGSHWRPNPFTPIVEFTNKLICDTMGWHYVWDRRDNAWHVYKRPDPNNPDDVKAGKFKPKAAFFTSPEDYAQTAGAQAELPSYLLSDWETDSEAPEFTTIMAITLPVVAPQVQTKAEYQNLLFANSGSAPQDAQQSDPALQTQARYHLTYFDNPNGYASPEHPNPDETSPDFLGRKSVLPVKLGTAPTQSAAIWLGRRLYDDLTHGRCFGSGRADWGDLGTAYLRKWDMVLINGENWMIDHIEAEWPHDAVRRARYRFSLYRDDAPPPR